MQVASFCGSLGSMSANAAALDVATRRVLEAGHHIVVVSGLDSIPPFNPEQVDDPAAVVSEFRRSLESCDAVLLSAPEYAGGVAGLTKNALDWLVGSGSLYHRSAGVLSAGTTGGVQAIDQLVRTLSWQGALVVAELGIDAPRTKMDAHGAFSDEATISAIEAWTDKVIAAASASPSVRMAMVSAIVTNYGIDPQRFGTIR
jgi:chromate reductase